MDLSGNRLYGIVPSTISQMTALTFLDLSSNAISGTVPTTLAALTGLRYFCGVVGVGERVVMRVCGCMCVCGCAQQVRNPATKQQPAFGYGASTADDNVSRNVHDLVGELHRKCYCDTGRL